MKDDDLVSRLAQILQRADRMAEYKATGRTSYKRQSAEEPCAELIHSAGQVNPGLRSILFGIAWMLISVVVIQIGSVTQSDSFRLVFYVGAAGYLAIGAFFFDRGMKRLASS